MNWYDESTHCPWNLVPINVFSCHQNECASFHIGALSSAAIRHDALILVTWGHIYRYESPRFGALSMCDMTHLYMCDMRTRSLTWRANAAASEAARSRVETLALSVVRNVTQLICIHGVPPVYMWHASFIYVPWLICKSSRVETLALSMVGDVTWLICICSMPHLYMCHDSFAVCAVSGMTHL